MSDTKVLKAATRRKPPNAGKGRVKGVPNKMTADIRAMILGALDAAGGQDYLADQAHANPGAFMALVGKVVPKELNVDGQIAVGSAIMERLSRAIART
jgi:hypothetical protein